MNTIREGFLPGLSDSDGETRLPDSSGTDQGHKPGKIERSSNTVDVALSSDEGRRVWQFPFGALAVRQICNSYLLGVNPRHELIAVTDDGREVGRLMQGIAQCAAKAANMDLEVVLVHMHFRPSKCDQVVLADFFACSAHEKVEEV